MKFYCIFPHNFTINCSEIRIGAEEAIRLVSWVSRICFASTPPPLPKFPRRRRHLLGTRKSNSHAILGKQFMHEKQFFITALAEVRRSTCAVCGGIATKINFHSFARMDLCRSEMYSKNYENILRGGVSRNRKSSRGLTVAWDCHVDSNRSALVHLLATASIKHPLNWRWTSSSLRFLWRVMKESQRGRMAPATLQPRFRKETRKLNRQPSRAEWTLLFTFLMTSRVEKAHRNGERRKWNWGERAFVTAPEGRVVAGIVLVSGCHIGEGLLGSASSIALSNETSSWKAGLISIEHLN